MLSTAHVRKGSLMFRTPGFRPLMSYLPRSGPTRHGSPARSRSRKPITTKLYNLPRFRTHSESLAVFHPLTYSSRNEKHAQSRTLHTSYTQLSNYSPLPKLISAEAPSFQDLGIKSSLCKVLKRDNIIVPTLIQTEALPMTLSRDNHCIIHSETGTGKTLTFLLAALQDATPALTTLILVPTRELAVQMHYQAVRLAGTRKDSKRILAMFSGVDIKKQLEQYNTLRPHILIGTPKRILDLLDTSLQDFSILHRLVLDEADKILMTPSKRITAKKKAVREIHPRPGRAIVERILTAPKRRGNTQLICTSATVNDALREELIQIGWGPDADLISTMTVQSLTPPRSIEHHYIVCSEQEGMNKLDLLLEHFYTSKEKSALVFIHRGASILTFVDELNEKGINAAALYSNTVTPTGYPQFLDEFKSGKIPLVVGTEETVRGLDFTWLNTVYIMEVPRSASEYLHLCGRVGRLGRHGRAVVFVTSEQEVKRMTMHYSRLGVHGKVVEI